MTADLLRTMGQIAGIGGLSLGVLLLVFRDIIRKTIFPQLTKQDAYRLLRLIAILVFLIAAFGLVAWVSVGSKASITFGDEIDANCSSVNTGTISGSSAKVDCSDAPAAK